MYTANLKKLVLPIRGVLFKTASLLVFFALYFLAHAQTKADMLAKLAALRSQKNYTASNAVVDQYNHVSFKYLFDKPDSCLIYADSAQQLAHTQQYTIGVIRALSNKAKGYYLKGSYDSSLTCSDAALRMCEPLNDSVGMQINYNNLGLIYIGHEQMQEAAVEFKKSLAIAIALHDTAQVATTYFNLAVCYDETNNLDSALLFLQKTIEKDKQNDSHRLTAMAYNRLGKTHFLKQQYTEAIYWYQQLLDYTAYKDDWEYTFANTGLGEVYYALGDYTQAISYGLQGYTIARKMNVKWDTEQALVVLAKAYAAKGDYKNAYTYQAMDRLYKDSLADESKNEVVGYMKLQQKEAVNEQLVKQNELKSQQIRTTWLYNIGISAVALALVISVIFLYRNYKAKALLNTQLLEKNSNIEHLNRMKDQLFAVVSHDLRGPVGSLLQTLELVIDDVLPEEQRKYMLENLHRQVTVSNQMLNNLLTWAATQRSGITARIEKIASGEIIKEVVSVFETLAAKKSIDIVFDVTGEKLLMADNNQLRIIIQNLVSNAIKFTPSGGNIKIYYSAKAGYTIINIQDTGEGMSEEKQARLFKSFGSVVSTFGTAREKGAGIGLMIVKEFVLQNNGQLSLSSQEGKGTIFSVTFVSAE